VNFALHFPPWWCWLAAIYIGTGIYIAMATLEVAMDELEPEEVDVRGALYLGGMWLVTVVLWAPQFALYALQARLHTSRH
jgi:uncharacterized membrane protein YkvI